MQIDWYPLWLGLRVAALATIAAVLIGIALAWLLARRDFRGKRWLEAAVKLPLVLPPAVLTYYVLAHSGRFPSLIFTWRWAAVASAVYATPLLVASTRTALQNLDPCYERASRSLGASARRVFLRVTLPLIRQSILAATALAFLRALADIGITLLIATKVAR